MQKKKSLKDTKGSVAVYVTITIFAFITVLATLFVSYVSIRKQGLKSTLNVKEAYEQEYNNREEAYKSLVNQAKTVQELKKLGAYVLENKTVEDETGEKVVIPKGCKITSDSADNISYGVVIEDENENQWVWVPVNNVSDMYSGNAAGVALTGETGVTTSRYSKSEIISGQTRVLPGDTSSYREPDISKKSTQDATYYETAGFSSLNDMATKLSSEYITMLKSVEKYGGFYIGRYELTANGMKPGETLRDIGWYSLYKNCKSLTIDEDVAISRMIWGCQWDMTCNFISNYGDQKSITDSSTWGNYSNYNTVNGYVEGDEGYEAGAGNIQNTGSSSNWKANNIYDLAGNIYEWTQEAYGTYARAYRGGGCGYTGDNLPVTNRQPIAGNYAGTIGLRNSSNLNPYTSCRRFFWRNSSRNYSI